MNDRLPFELTTPGTWVDLPDGTASQEIQTQLILLQSAFSELSLALHLFERDLETARKEGGIEEWKAQANRRTQLMWEALAETGVDEFGRPDFWQAMQIGSRRAWLEQLTHGVLPRELRFSAAFLHAKAFLHAADSIGKIITRLGERNDVPSGVSDASKAFYQSFPTLTDVRDSIQHMEDRGRGLRRGGKPLALKPVRAARISAPQGALILNNLNSRSFGTTLANGTYGEVPVTEDSLGKIRDHLEALFAALPWKGPRQLFPS